MRWLLAAVVVAIVLAGFVHLNSTARLYNNSTNTMGTSTLSLKIPVFADGASIPAKYTCDAASAVSPAIEISDIPSGTASLALIMDDPDIPAVFKQQRGISEYVHWVLFNIPATTTEIAEGGSAGVAGANGGGQNAYTGPCPPPQYEPSEHRYIFKLYALDQILPVPSGATKDMVEKAMDGHILVETQYTGRYKRQ